MLQARNGARAVYGSVLEAWAHEGDCASIVNALRAEWRGCLQRRSLFRARLRALRPDPSKQPAWTMADPPRPGEE